MYLTIGTIALALRQGLEAKCEVFVTVCTAEQLSPEHCHSCVCEGVVVCHSNTDIMTPVAWSATVECHLCLRRL